MFDPSLTTKINAASTAEYGKPKYPDFQLNTNNTGELFGMDYSQDLPDSIEGADHIETLAPKEEDEQVFESGLEPSTQSELQNLMSSTQASPSVNPAPSPPPSTNSATGADRIVVRRQTISGTMKPLPFEQWTEEMKEIINRLLATCHSKKDKLTLVERQYLCHLYADADNPDSCLRCTNRRFIQLYERHLHRRVEANTALNATPEQTATMREVTQELERTGAVAVDLVSPSTSQVSHIPSESRKRPPETTTPAQTPQDTTQLNQQLLQAILRMQVPSTEASSSSGPATKRRRVTKNPNSGTMKARNCLYCGQPKPKMSSERNLHHTHIKKGEPCYFYCPVKIRDLYGLPPETTFGEFLTSPYWQTELEEARKRKEEKERQKLHRGENRKDGKPLETLKGKILDNNK